MNLTARLERLEKKQKAEGLLCHAFLEQAKCFFQVSRESEGRLRRWWYFSRGLAYQNKAVIHLTRENTYFKEYWQLRREIKEALESRAQASGYELKFERIYESSRSV